MEPSKKGDFLGAELRKSSAFQSVPPVCRAIGLAAGTRQAWDTAITLLDVRGEMAVKKEHLNPWYFAYPLVHLVTQIKKTNRHIMALQAVGLPQASATWGFASAATKLAICPAEEATPSKESVSWVC